ncbi:MAG: hypothetical protein IPH44_42310 [Myxococcales bacterium]|nr:hypothetical protein [Myxococcales bacterium]MBK7192970.1 hypothetical protein [Myxococcales bacterium]MBP6844172.1 hypothetical protein [Kofleriaceae bacterium]
MTWVDLVARARGRSTHLAAEDALAAIDRAADRGALLAALAQAGWVIAPTADALAAARALDEAATARATAELALLTRWAAARTAALAVIVADEDRRTLRGIVRGLTAAAAPTSRLRGAVATPDLPASALRELAAAATGPALAAALTQLAHPAAVALAPALTHQPLEPLAVEQALAAWFAARARAGAHAAGDRALAEHVAQAIDAENAAAALALANRGRGLAADSAFLIGGRRVDRATFLAAARAAPAACVSTLAAALVGTPLVTAVDGGAPDAIERATQAWQLATQARWRRVEPLGLGPVLWLWLRMRREHAQVRLAAWRLALGGAS